MPYTYTHSLTKQERTIRDLNSLVYEKIRSSFEGSAGDKYQYKALSKNGDILEEKPMNLYEEGALIGDDFLIYKKEGIVDHTGYDINYVYISKAGEIHSFGEKYANCYVLLPGNIKIGLLEFYTHPEVEELLKSVSKKLGNDEKKGHNYYS